MSSAWEMLEVMRDPALVEALRQSETELAPRP
jgi:hypothetical protein